MKVAELQEFIRSLVQPLQNAGARGPAGDLERMRAGLEPFKDLAVAEFADFLARAHQFVQEGTVPVKGRGRTKPAADPARVQTATQQVQALYEQALEPSFQEATLDSEMKKLDKQLTTEEAVEVARQLHLGEGLKTKKDAIAAIRQKFTVRKPAAPSAPEPAEPAAAASPTV